MKNEKTFRPDRIFSYFRVEWLPLAFVTLSGLIYNIGLLATPCFEGRLAQCLADILSGSETAAQMALLVLAYILVTLLVQASRFIKRFYVRRFANNINRRMKGILYANLVRQSRAALEKEGAGELMTKAIADVDDCVEGMRKFTTEVFDTGVALAGYAVMLLVYDWRLAILGLLFTPVSYVCAAGMKKPVQRAGAAYKKAAGALSSATLDRARNAVTYRIYGCEEARMEKYEETLPYFENLSKEGLYSNSDLNEAYIQILEKTGNRSKIFSVLEECVRENVMTPAMLEMLKKVYTEKYGKSEGFEEYVQSLKSMKELEEMKKEVKAGLTNVAVEPFVLESMTGKKVNSKDWKGKIVVLDFWATWCGPCKMAFPGMQMAVDKYAKDKEVEFYFIATQESGDKYKQKIKEYFAKNDFTFNVLYDNYNEKSQSANIVFSRFAKMFNDSGIPRKVILKDGVMRYTSGGYCGSPSKLADEISYVIELLKAEK